MKQADETLLTPVLVMERIGYRVFALARNVHYLTNLDPITAMAVCRAEGHGLDDRAEQNKSKHTRQKRAGLPLSFSDKRSHLFNG